MNNYPKGFLPNETVDAGWKDYLQDTFKDQMEDITMMPYLFPIQPISEEMRKRIEELFSSRDFSKDPIILEDSSGVEFINNPFPKQI